MGGIPLVLAAWYCITMVAQHFVWSRIIRRGVIPNDAILCLATMVRIGEEDVMLDLDLVVRGRCVVSSRGW